MKRVNKMQCRKALHVHQDGAPAWGAKGVHVHPPARILILLVIVLVSEFYFKPYLLPQAARLLSSRCDVHSFVPPRLHSIVDVYSHYHSTLYVSFLSLQIMSVTLWFPYFYFHSIFSLALYDCLFPPCAPHFIPSSSCNFRATMLVRNTSPHRKLEQTWARTAD